MSSEETAADVAIRVHDVSKHFLLFDRPQDRLKQSIVPRLQRLIGRPPTRYYRDFAALSGVSFEVRRGETVGIVGRNGSGKSTLLQVVCGTLRPNAGSVAVNGRIAALLELGAGFNPEFTGRENVYLNAAILGLSREETDARFDDIARFADIGDFIGQPVKTYSSGMYVRLAFATAINVDPDILVVDEALSVGDEAFQRKCFARIEQIQERGGTILFVTHSAQLVVQLCSRALLMDRGELIMDGRPKLVTSQYQRLVNLSGGEADEARRLIRNIADDEPSADTASDPRPVTSAETTEEPTASGQETPRSTLLECLDPSLVSRSSVAYESHGATIHDPRLLRLSGDPVNVLETGSRYIYEYLVSFDSAARSVGFGMMVRTVNGLDLAGAATSLSRASRLPKVAVGEVVRVRFEFTCTFAPGTYFLNAGVLGMVGDYERYLHRVLDWVAFRVVTKGGSIATGLVDIDTRPDVLVLHPECHVRSSSTPTRSGSTSGVISRP